MSDLANLILYQETVQTGSYSGMTISAKSWCSVVSSEAVQKKAGPVLSVGFKLSPEQPSPQLETTVESPDSPVGMSRS